MKQYCSKNVASDSPLLEDITDDNMFLDSESETDSFVDFDSTFVDCDSIEPDYALMSDADIPEMEEPSQENTLAQEAHDIESKFIELLSDPTTRIRILTLTGNRYTSSKEARMFATRYASALSYNRALSIYPKLVKALNFKEFHSKDGELCLHVSNKTASELIYPLASSVDPAQIQESPISELVENICNQLKELSDTSVDFDGDVDVSDIELQDPDTISPDYQLMDEENPEIPEDMSPDGRDLSHEYALEVEQDFLDLLSKPDTRDRILVLTGSRYTASEQNKAYTAKYVTALSHNRALSIYPKLVKALSHDQFNAKNGELSLNVSSKTASSLIYPLSNTVDSDLSQESPVVKLVEDICSQLRELTKGQSFEDDYQIPEIQLQDPDTIVPDYLEMDKENAEIPVLQPADLTDHEKENALALEQEFIDLLASPSTRDKILVITGNKYSTVPSATAKRYASALRHNKALSAYPKLVKALKFDEFNSCDNSLSLNISSKVASQLIYPLASNLEPSLKNESPIVELLQTIYEKIQEFKENKSKAIVLQNNNGIDRTEKTDLNVSTSDLDSQDFDLPVQEEFQAQNIYVDNSDALGGSSIHTNESSTPIGYNPEHLTDKPTQEDTNGLQPPLYTVSSASDNLISISLMDLANKTIATYLADKGIIQPSSIHSYLKKEGFSNSRINEIVGITKYLTLKKSDPSL